MKELLYWIVEWIAKIHSHILRLNDAYEYNFTDKELHFLVIGMMGMGFIFVVYPVFKWLAKHDHVMVIAWIYVLTLIIVSSILDFIRKPNIPPDINATALYDLQGNAFFLPQLDQAKPTIIYFWGSWCGYCRYTSPAINSLSEEGYPVVSVALRSGTNKDVEDYLQTHHYQFTTVNDPQGKIADQWQVNVTPTIIILNKGKMDLATTGWTSYWGLKVRLFFTEFFG